MTAQNRRDLILDVTETLLVEIGNGELTMRKIAVAADISLGNLQYHFATREALLLALLARFLEPYEARIQNTPRDLPEDMLGALTKLFEEALCLPNLDRCATIYKEIWAASSHSPEMQDALKTYYGRLLEFYRTVLTQVAPPDTMPAKINRAAAALLPLLEGYCVTKDAVDGPIAEIAQDWAKMTTALMK